MSEATTNESDWLNIRESPSEAVPAYVLARRYRQWFLDTWDTTRCGPIRDCVRAPGGMGSCRYVARDAAHKRMAAALHSGQKLPFEHHGLQRRDVHRMLEVGRLLGQTQPVDVVNTFLGAHDFPPDLPQPIDWFAYAAGLDPEFGEMLAEAGAPGAVLAIVTALLSIALL